MAQTLQIYRNSGWIGHGDRPPAERIKPMKRQILINEEEWNEAGILMPPNVRELLWNQERTNSTDEELLEREYADEAEADSNILLPPGVKVRG